MPAVDAMHSMMSVVSFMAARNFGFCAQGKVRCLGGVGGVTQLDSGERHKLVATSDAHLLGWAYHISKLWVGVW